MRLVSVLPLASLLLAFSSHAAGPDVETIISRSVAANERDWRSAANYDFVEEDGTGDQSKTYEVHMILGSPYRKLVKVHGQDLSAEERQKEQQKMQDEVAHRRKESPSERQKRISQYEKERARDHLLLSQITKAFDFSLTGTRTVDGYRVYVLRATPRKGYMPPNREAEVLTGMEGELSIDTKTFQWVRVSAAVLRPVSIEGFLARVEPGTRFELENMPVAPGIWLPKHYSMRAQAKILSVINHESSDEERYFGYRKSAAQKVKP
jgi:hypothetical protein